MEYYRGEVGWFGASKQNGEPIWKKETLLIPRISEWFTFKLSAI